MAKAKFKVGDKVRILDGSKIENYTGGWSPWGMQENVGEVVTIKGVCEYDNDRIGYRMKEICCTWDERGLELVESKDKDKETIVIYRDGNEVIAFNKKTKEKAVAKCNPSDEFNFKVGAKIAFDRLIRKFRVGDLVIGNDKADCEYAITKTGWVGRVVAIPYEGTIRVCPEDETDDCEFSVDSDCFDYYIKPEKSEKPKPKRYTASVVCIKKGKGLWFTAGKIYDVKDGIIRDDRGEIRLSGSIESLEYLNNHICGGSEFIELVK